MCKTNPLQERQVPISSSFLAANDTDRIFDETTQPRHLVFVFLAGEGSRAHVCHTDVLTFQIKMATGDSAPCPFVPSDIHRRFDSMFLLIYLCSGEHFQSDLDIFKFDFMFVKPSDVHPLLCFGVQTEMRFGVE